MTNEHASELSKLATTARRKISPERRKQIASHASRMRWKGHKKHSRSTEK